MAIPLHNSFSDVVHIFRLLSLSSALILYLSLSLDFQLYIEFGENACGANGRRNVAIYDRY